MRRQFVDGSHGQMHLRVAGMDRAIKRPIVCLHMFPQSGRNFEAFVKRASTDRVVVAPDFPGHGESSPPGAPITAEAYAESVWVVIDALSLLDSHGQIDFFGVHAGAKLAVEAANQRRNDVCKIVLSSAAVLLPDEVDRLRASFEPIPLDEEGTRLKRLWELIVKNRHDGMTLEMCAIAFAEILRGGEQYEWGHHAVFDYNRRFPDVLQSLPHPIALLNPGDELYDMTRRSLSLLQRGTYFDLRDWGHGYLDVHVDEVVRLVHGWLDGSE